MAFTNGSIFGCYDGQATSGSNSAWNATNSTNPNQQPASDLFQIYVGGAGLCILQVTATGTVNVNSSVTNVTPGTMVARVQMSLAAYNTLPTTPTAAQIMAATFPANYNGAQLDVFQIASQIATINVAGGNSVIQRFTYSGSVVTS
jgi:hypothetical protein